MVPASYLYADGDGYHFMDQENFETLTLRADIARRRPAAAGRQRARPDPEVQRQPDRRRQFPPHVELTVASTEPGVRGDTASGGVTKAATLETGLEIRVPALHQGRREGQGPHRDAGVRGKSLGN